VNVSHRAQTIAGRRRNVNSTVHCALRVKPSTAWGAGRPRSTRPASREPNCAPPLELGQESARMHRVPRGIPGMRFSIPLGQRMGVAPISDSVLMDDMEGTLEWKIL
jgi:hypothetical protein